MQDRSDTAGRRDMLTAIAAAALLPAAAPPPAQAATAKPPLSGHLAIPNLYAAYSFAVDQGDFVAYGALFAQGALLQPDGSVWAKGADAIAAAMNERNRRQPPPAGHVGRHIITNLHLEVNDEAGTASGRAYFVSWHSVPGKQPEIGMLGRYASTFARSGGTWHFVTHQYFPDWTPGPFQPEPPYRGKP